MIPVRRLGIVVTLTACALMLPSPPASATCLSMPFDQAVDQADAVWWATVIEADLRGPGGGNNWTLTVRIDNVLKGP